MSIGIAKLLSEQHKAIDTLRGQLKAETKALERACDALFKIMACDKCPTPLQKCAKIKDCRPLLMEHFRGSG